MTHFKSYRLEFIHNVKILYNDPFANCNIFHFTLEQAMSPWWYVSACPINLLVGNILILDLLVITLIRIQEKIRIIYTIWLWFCCIISILDLVFTIGLSSERNTALSPQAHYFHVIFSQTTMCAKKISSFLILPALLVFGAFCKKRCPLFPSG